MKENTVLLRIYRSNTNGFEKYEVPAKGSITLQRAIKYVYENLDRTLAFRNYSCYKGVCSNCMVNLNGKNVRSCSVLLQPGEEAVVEPAKGFPVIRDLVVDFNRPREE